MAGAVATHWIDQYDRDGYYAPLRVLSPDDARACRARLEAFEATRGPLQGDLRHRAHVFLVWLDDLVRNARILDAVEAVLGKNLLVWTSSFFIKEGGDGAQVPWHQDSRAFGVRAPDVVTAWVALTDSTPENGALQVIPGSHRRGELVHAIQPVRKNLLTRRPASALGVDGSAATIVPLRAGEMSLHHASLVHGSQPNGTNERRIGIAIRYVRPGGGPAIGCREPALLVRGVDLEGSFDPPPRPERDAAPEALARHAELTGAAGSGRVVHVEAESWPRAVTLRGTLLGRNGQGVLLCGPSGPGLAALAAALTRRGWISMATDVGEGRSDGDANRDVVTPRGPSENRAHGRIDLSAILFLGPTRPEPDETRFRAMPAAHALLALLPYRGGGDRADLARGIRELEPLVTAVPLYDCPSASDQLVDAVERFVQTAVERCRSNEQSSRAWAHVDATAAGQSTLRTPHDMEGIHD